MDYNKMSPHMEEFNAGVVTAQPLSHVLPPHEYYSQAPPPQQTSQTTVIVAQQQQQRVMYGERGWNTGLFDCFTDCGTCICGMFCMSCLLSTVSGKLGESSCVPCFVPGGIIALRVKLRTKHRIEGSIMKDCAAWTCCGPCMVCQMDRELTSINRTTPTNII